jgi:hypothetical protein
MIGAVCDRCGKPFRTTLWPHNCLCRACYLGDLSALERAAELVSGAR